MLIKLCCEAGQTPELIDVASEVAFSIVNSRIRYADVELTLGRTSIEVTVNELRQMHAAVEAALAEVDAIATVAA